MLTMMPMAACDGSNADPILPEQPGQPGNSDGGDEDDSTDPTNPMSVSGFPSAKVSKKSEAMFR